MVTSRLTPLRRGADGHGPISPLGREEGVWLHTLVLLDWQGECGLDPSSLGRRGEAKVKVVMPHPFPLSRKGRASGHANKEEKVDMASPLWEEAGVRPWSPLAPPL